MAALRGYAYGLGLFGCGVHWVYVSVHRYGGVPPAGAVAITALLVAWLALFPAASAWLLARLRPGRDAAGLLLVFPAAWLAGEALRGWLLTGFPWLAAGYSQIDGPLAGLAPLGGVQLVGLAVALSAGALPELSVLMLSSNELTAESVADLAGARLPDGTPALATLDKLHLDHNHIGHSTIGHSTIDSLTLDLLASEKMLVGESTDALYTPFPVMAPTTPTGSRFINASVSLPVGAISPYTLSIHSAVQRKQSMESGTSIDTISLMGLPISSVSIKANSSRCCSSRSASFSKICFRSLGAACDHAPLLNASLAACTARSISRSLQLAMSASFCSVAGLMLGNVSPLCAA